MARKEAFTEPRTEERPWPLYGFRGSSYGGCLHSLVLILQGITSRPPSEELKARFQLGHESELRCKQALASAGFVMEDAQHELDKQRNVFVEEVFRFEDFEEPRSVKIGCSLDGWFKNRDALGGWLEAGYSIYPYPNALPADGPITFEHKSTTLSKFESLLEAFSLVRHDIRAELKQWNPQYAYQTSAQAWGLELYIREQTLVSQEPLDGLPCLFSVECINLDEAGNPGPRHQERVCFLLPAPVFGPMECLGRCLEAVWFFENNIVPECDAIFDCRFREPDWGATYKEIDISALPVLSNEPVPTTPPAPKKSPEPIVVPDGDFLDGLRL